MKNSIILAFMSSFVLGFTSCGHNHEQSPVMKEVVEINVRLWEDLNSAKAEVRSRIEKVVDYYT